jgi:hypothetical protein
MRTCIKKKNHKGLKSKYKKLKPRGPGIKNKKNQGPKEYFFHAPWTIIIKSCFFFFLLKGVILVHSYICFCLLLENKF